MYYMTIDDLLEDVNRVVQMPNQEDLRNALVRHTITVYRKIKIKEPQVIEIYTVDTKNKTIVLPQSVYKVYDVGLDCGNNFDSHRLLFPEERRIPYRVDKNKIRFSEDLKGVSVALITLPKDDDGNLLIDERIYDAVLNYCIGQELLVKSSNVKQDYATMNPAQYYIQQGRTLIDEARAAMNETTPGEYRKLEHELRRLF